MRDCRCGKQLLAAVNEGTCLWCGYGDIVVVAPARRAPEPRLPWNLGELAREGRRPDPRCGNVVRLDRLRVVTAAVEDEDAEMAA
jgi:hypothetical protein